MKTKYDILSDDIKKIFIKIGLNHNLNLSEKAFNKFCALSSYTLIYNYSSQEMQNFTTEVCFGSRPNIPNRIIAYFQILFVFSKNILGYLAYLLLFNLTNKIKHNHARRIINKIKYIFISTPIAIPTLTESNIGKISSDECLFAYTPNLNFQAIERINNEYDPTTDYNLFFLDPISLKIDLFVKLLKYSFSTGILMHHFIKQMHHGRNKECLTVHNLIFEMYLHNCWAENTAKYLAELFPKCTIIFDHEFQKNTLFLVEQFNKLNIKTVLIQHGVDVGSNNPAYVDSLCKYTICCSKRDIENQTKAGVSAEKIFISGAPLQLAASINNESHDNIKKAYDIVILGGYGPEWIHEHYLNLLHMAFSNNFLNLKIYLRIHPRNNSSKRLLWSKFSPNIIISKNKSFLNDILLGDVIITFSEDALALCLHLNKKVIFCVDSKDFHHDIDFLIGKDFVKICETPAELTEAIKYFNSFSDESFMGKFDAEFIINNFGVFDQETIASNILKSLEVIHQR